MRHRPRHRLAPAKDQINFGELLKSAQGRSRRYLSIPDQRRQAKGYCASRGWEIVADYVKHGVSARDDRRPEFLRMIDAATTKPPAFEVIVVHSLPRIASCMRSPVQSFFRIRTPGTSMPSLEAAVMRSIS
jgi:DNA invertase Pin-like site-specific DNA recombinase